MSYVKGFYKVLPFPEMFTQGRKNVGTHNSSNILTFCRDKML